MKSGIISFTIILFFFIATKNLCAQEIAISTPQKVTTGYSKVEVLGRNNQGILVRDIIKDDDQISCFYDNMQLHWKKVVPHKEKNIVTEEIILYPDSTLFFYTVTEKGTTFLKAYKTNSRIESPTASIICDTISKNYLSQPPRPNFALSPDKSFILIWFADVNFDNNGLVHLTCINYEMKKLWDAKVKLSSIEHPDPFWAAVDSAGNATLVSGDYKIKNFNNDFHYTSLLLSTFKNNGTVIHHSVLLNKNFLLTAASVKQDLLSGKVLLSGMYSNDPGSRSDGIYFFVFDSRSDSLLTERFEAYTPEFITSLTGNSPPKKNDGFYDFQNKDLIVTKNGGAIFLAQSESVTSESFTTTSIGGFGGTNGFTVNYYHYDDIIVYSFSPTGAVEWKQVLHKKQSTEGDGGYYSSFLTMIGASKLSFIYNDASNGQKSVTAYDVDAAGTQARKEIFNADRKGVNVAPRHSKQISVNEVVLPSYKKNYLQFVKITF